jgi:hypothetical protein
MSKNSFEVSSFLLTLTGKIAVEIVGPGENPK